MLSDEWNPFLKKSQQIFVFCKLVGPFDPKEPPSMLLSHLSHRFACTMEIQLKSPSLNAILSFWERKNLHGTKCSG